MKSLFISIFVILVSIMFIQAEFTPGYQKPADADSENNLNFYFDTDVFMKPHGTEGHVHAFQYGKRSETPNIIDKRKFKAVGLLGNRLKKLKNSGYRSRYQKYKNYFKFNSISNPKFGH